MNWLGLTSLSILFFTILPLSQRKIAINNKYPRAAAVIFVLCGFIVSTIILIVNRPSSFTWPREPLAWIFLFLAMAFYGLFERGRFIAAKAMDASTLSVVSNVSIFIGFVGSVFLYNESLTVAKIVGALMIFLSIFFISYNKKVNLNSAKGVLIGVLVYSILGFGWALDKKGSQYFGAEIYNFLGWLLPLAFIVFPIIKKAEFKYEIKKTGWKFMIPAFLNVGGYFLQLKAMETGNATQIIPLVQTSTLLTVFAGIVFLGESQGMAKKIFSGVLALIGSYLLIGAI